MTDESNAGERDVSQPNEAPQTPEKTFTKKPFAKKDGFKKDGGKDGKPPPKATERIAKVLARAGLASRREVERLIGLGKIAVNGRILETPAVLVSSVDVITVEGQVIGKAEPTRVWRYHKPVGLITTHSDPQGRPTLFEQLPGHLPRVISVGRLDLNSEGLLLLTNDGELARSLEKPSSGWVRRYRVRALGHASQSRLDSLKDGTTVDGVIYGPMEATIDKVAEKADGRANVWLTVAITEGKNREVRKVLESIGLKVNRLIRLAYGPFQLGNLETGEVEEVGPRVIRELLADVVPLKNLPPEGASQTRDAPRERPARSDGPAGRRGGGDRFDKSDRPGGDRFGGDRKPARPRPEFTEKREFKERDFDQRPRFEGDGEARDRKPERPFERKPYGERQSFDQRKPYGARDGGDARSSYTPRPDRGAGNDRKPFDKKPYGDRPAQGEAGAYERAKREFGAPDRSKPRFDRPAGDDTRSSYTPRPDRGGGDAQKPYASKPYAKKPYAPRPAQGEAGAYDRAKREFGAPDRSKPRFDRPAGDDTRSSYTPRPDRGGEDRKPYAKKPYDGKPRGDRPAGEGYKKPYGARSDSEGGSGFKRDFAPRPDREGGAGGGYKKPFVRKGPPRDGEGGERSYAKPFRPAGDRPAYKGREEGGEGRKSFGDRPRDDRPRDDRPRGDRPQGDRPRTGGFGGKPGGGPRSDGPRGPRPGGPRPGGKPSFGRKPPRDQ